MSLANKSKSELGLLLLMGSATGAMVLIAQSYTDTAATFPQLIGIATLVLIFLALTEDYLPKPLKEVVTESDSLFNNEEMENELDEHNVSDEGDTAPTSNDVEMRYDILNPTQITTVLISVYLLGSYFFSLIVMSPLFIIVYLYWFKKPISVIAFLTFSSIAVCFAFVEYVNIPIGRGRWVDLGLLSMVFGL